MAMEKLNPSQLAAPLGRYSQVVRSRTKEILHIAGQVAIDAAGNLIGEGDIEVQARQSYENIRLALEACDADMSHVTQITVYLTAMAHLDGFRSSRDELYEEYFPDGAYPASTLLIVAGLVDERFLIEIDAVAAI